MAAIDEENESIRFNLMLSARFEKPEAKFGDGFFSSVLVEYVKQSPLFESQTVREVIKYASTNQPYRGGTGYEYCREMIEGILRDCWADLNERLKYSDEASERILGRAVAHYLDERFSVTDRRNLGWL